MKVHILGKGMISLLGLNAPIRNIDLPEKKIRGLVLVPTLKVVDAATNLYINKNNVDQFFEEKNAPVEAAPVKKEAPKKKEKKAEPVPAPVTEEPSKEEIVAAVKDVIITEPTPVTEEPEETPVEETTTVEATVEEEDVPAEDEEESVEETEEEAPSYNKKKNKKRR